MARQAPEDARARPRSSSGITLVEADNQPPAPSSADASPFDPVDDGPPMPFDPLDVFDDDECAARAQAEALELETLRRESYGRNLTLGHVVREFTEEYRQTAAYLELSPATRARQERVLRDLLGCRTSAMGEHEWHCGSCDQTYVYFNSCGNRHCPTCREGYRREWAEKVALDLLPVPYEHVMLTLPRPLTQLVMAHGDALYSTVMQAGGAALMAVGRKFLATLGVLHAWGC